MGYQYKVRVAVTGGNNPVEDATEYADPIDLTKDAIEAAGLIVTDANNTDETTTITRTNNDMLFTDGYNTSPASLSDLKYYSGILVTSNEAISIGDCVCLDRYGKVVKATSSNLSTAGAVEGIAITSCTGADQRLTITDTGAVSPTITGLSSDSYAASVRVNTTTAKAERLGNGVSFTQNDYPLGCCNSYGWLTLVRGVVIGYASQGPQGYQGLQGSQGVQGFQGNQGNQGRQGYQGDRGYQGDKGFQGNQGFQGSQGNQGNQGNQGDQGFQGFQGNQGNQGSQGNQGYQGIQGILGIDGVQGAQGDQGNQGFQGSQGFQGVLGHQGYQGEFGYQGIQGATGTFPDFYSYFYAGF